MAVRNVSSIKPSVARNASGGFYPKSSTREKGVVGSPRPFRGSRICISCNLFYAESKMIEIPRYDRFDEPIKSAFVCKSCNHDDGIVNGLDDHLHRYEHGTGGYGWVENDDPKRNWNWEDPEVET